jgi:hypothetical protein
VPTSTAEYAHWRLSALPKLAVDAITNFLSEFRRLSPESSTRQRGVASLRSPNWCVGCDRTTPLVACLQPSTAKGARAPSTARTAIARLPPFNGTGRDRRGPTVVWMGPPAAWEAAR